MKEDGEGEKCDLCFVNEEGGSEMCVLKRKEEGGGVCRGEREEEKEVGGEGAPLKGMKRWRE